MSEHHFHVEEKSDHLFGATFPLDHSAEKCIDCRWRRQQEHYHATVQNATSLAAIEEALEEYEANRLEYWSKVEACWEDMQAHPDSNPQVIAAMHYTSLEIVAHLLLFGGRGKYVLPVVHEVNGRLTNRLLKEQDATSP